MRRPRSTRAVLAAVLSLGVLAGGCGYRLVARDARLPGGISRVDVPVAANRTREAGLESGATAAVIDALRRYGRAEIGPNSPQAVVRITLLAAEGRARAVGGGVPAAFRAVLRQEVTLEDPRTGAALWRSGPMERELDYSIPPLTSGDEVLGAEDLRRRALDALAVRLGEEAVHRMLGGP